MLAGAARGGTGSKGGGGPVRSSDVDMRQFNWRRLLWNEGKQIWVFRGIEKELKNV